MLMSIDEAKISREDIEAIEIPPSEVVNELHGKSVFPIHKLMEEIRPNSFTESMTEENVSKASGSEMDRPFMCKGFVKPNEVLGKIKPRLIHDFGTDGSAGSALMNKTIEAMLFRLPYFVKQSIKGTDTVGTNDRIHRLITRYRSGGIASTDFGSFNASVTDKATSNHKKLGLRKIVEKRVMDAIWRAFPESHDLGNAAQNRWLEKYTVIFDSFRLIDALATVLRRWEIT